MDRYMKSKFSFALSVAILFVLSLPVPLVYFFLLQDAIAAHGSMAAPSGEAGQGISAVPLEMMLLKELGFLSAFIPFIIMIVPFIRARGEETLRKHKLLLSLGLLQLSFNTAYAVLALLLLVREWNE